MGQGVGRGTGEILSLIDLHREHPAAFEASLIERGLRWREIGSERFDWADLHAVISNLPYDDPLMRAMNPKTWFWFHPMNDIIAGIFDRVGLMAAVVERRQKIKRADVPKPLVRPWDKQKDVKKIGDKPVPIDDMRRLLGW